MTTDGSQSSGCGSAIVGFVVLAVLGWVISWFIPVHCEWLFVNNFEKAQAFVLGIPAGSGSGPRGIHQEVMRQAHQRKQIVVIGILAVLGAMIGKWIGTSSSENAPHASPAGPDLEGQGRSENR